MIHRDVATRTWEDIVTEFNLKYYNRVTMRNHAKAGQSNVVTGQLLIANTLAHVLIDSGATHSFASCKFAECMSHDCDVLRQGFSTSLPTGEILFSSHWLRAIPMIISGRELYVDLVILNMHDYDVILGMNFLGKYNATIKCRSRKIIFRLLGEVDLNKEKMADDPKQCFLL
ncbi:hypothetical protein UlMin_024069 [Ulmus minor]